MKRVKESARRAYGEIIRGRTRVRLIHEESRPAETPPRFILSLYRSGTTLLRYCLDSHPQLAVPPETDFIGLLAKILEDQQSLAGYRDLGYDAEDARRVLADAARRPLDTYAAGRDASAGWVDKSPRNAESPASIYALFPDSRMVIMHRHPLDQIHSFTRGGSFCHPALRVSIHGEELIAAAAEYWRANTKLLIQESESHAESTLAMRYEDLCAQPERILRDVLSHYGLEWSSEVLKYHAHDHDLGREAGRVAGTRGFSVSADAWRNWPAEWAERAWEVTSREATLLGYTIA
ncbi:sulfotransferase family protein [Serinicoccus kebangsaanensis]|uniref:sulfotransferase family protein n=1 Tax=Serinicoccus kebangsaanensis TaxID=2602069 RepID=UPI00124E149C